MTTETTTEPTTEEDVRAARKAWLAACTRARIARVKLREAENAAKGAREIYATLESRLDDIVRARQAAEQRRRMGWTSPGELAPE